MTDRANLEFLREWIEETSARLSRAALIAIVVISVVGYATSRAMRTLKPLKLDQQFTQAIHLATISGDASALSQVSGASPARQFLLLSSLVAAPMARQSGNTEADPRKTACAALQREESVTADVVACCAVADKDPYWRMEACRTIGDRATKTADQVEDQYREAFSVAIGTEGAEVQIDLRNWLMLLPPGIILATCYFYLLTRQRAMLRFVGRHLAMLDSKTSVVDRLFFGASGGGRRMDRPWRTISAPLLVGVGALQVWALTSSLQQLLGREADDAVGPSILYGMAATFLAAQFCLKQSAGMDEAVFSETRIVPPSPFLVRITAAVRDRWRSVLARMPKRTSVMAACAVLATLALPMSMTDCDPTTGFRFTTHPVSPRAALDGTDSWSSGHGAWWLPTMSLDKTSAPGESRWNLRRVALLLDQESAYVLYLAVLAGAGASLMIVGLSLRGRPAAAWVTRMVIGVLCAGGAFFAVDMTLFYSGPLMRLVGLSVLVPVTALSLMPANGGRISRGVRWFGGSVAFPMILAGQAFWVGCCVLYWEILAGCVVLTLAPILCAQALGAIAGADGTRSR